MAENREFEYQKYGRYFAQVPNEMEQICEQEIKSLGGEKVKAVYRGVYFYADKETLYKINYKSRLITRILAPLITFDCHSTKYLTKTAKKFPWEDIFSLKETFAITASVSNSYIKHSLYASQCLKDGIVDHFRELYDKRPNVELDTPDARFNLHIDRNKAVISIDVSGESLHKRGYRKEALEAPMQETLAAALVHLSKWDGEKKLWDCMCGSGTITAEALMSYCNIPAGYLRKRFGFMALPDFDKAIWEKVKVDAEAEMRPLPKNLLYSSDKSVEAVNIAKRNLANLPFSENINFRQMPFEHQTKWEDSMIICNPPYGVRMGTKEEVMELYKEMGNFLKKKCNGTSAFIYIGDKSMRRSIGLKPTKKYPLINGTLEGELLQIDSYRVSFRDNKKSK